jgi:DNA-binding transcriptional ArsR family regulator
MMEPSTQSEDLCDARVIHPDRVERARLEIADERSVERLAEAFGILGDPTRLKMLMVLRKGEMCVCDIAACLGVTESAVSHQLRRLYDRSLLRRRREGRCLYYRLDDEHVYELLQLGLEHVGEMK